MARAEDETNVTTPEDGTPEEGAFCANHPDRETKVFCSHCGKPICPDCMHFGAVGVKCAECARPTRGMLALGKPRQYVGAAAAGLIAAFVGGLILREALFVVRAPLILSALLGLGVGRAVKWGAQGNRGTRFAVIGGAAGFVAALVGLGPGALFSPIGLLSVVIITALAAYLARE